MSYLFTGFTKAERHKVRGREIFLQAANKPWKSTLCYIGHLEKVHLRRSADYVLLGCPLSYLDQEVGCTTRDRGESWILAPLNREESILDLKKDTNR